MGEPNYRVVRNIIISHQMRVGQLQGNKYPAVTYKLRYSLSWLILQMVPGKLGQLSTVVLRTKYTV